VTAAVLRLGEVARESVVELLATFGLDLILVPDGQAIPGSYWGEDEAGLIATSVYARTDTPLHSILHEACHVICAPPERRTRLHTDASDSVEEENAVCYLQILLADAIPGFGRRRALADMDAWGYSFRYGSAARWFHDDAEDARAWLLREGLIDDAGRPTGRLRGAPV
jgi:hypothetical protein